MLAEDDPNVKAKLAAMQKVKTDLRDLVAADEVDTAKWKVEAIVAHIKLIEQLLGIR